MWNLSVLQSVMYTSSYLLPNISPSRAQPFYLINLCAVLHSYKHKTPSIPKYERMNEWILSKYWQSHYCSEPHRMVIRKFISSHDLPAGRKSSASISYQPHSPPVPLTSTQQCRDAPIIILIGKKCRKTHHGKNKRTFPNPYSLTHGLAYTSSMLLRLQVSFMYYTLHTSQRMQNYFSHE